MSCIFIIWNVVRTAGNLNDNVNSPPRPPSLLTFKSTISSRFGLAVASHSIWRRVREKNQSASILYWTQFLTHLMALRLLLSAGMPTDRANDRWSSHLQQFGYRIWDTFFPIVKCPLVMAKKNPKPTPSPHPPTLQKKKKKKAWKSSHIFKGTQMSWHPNLKFLCAIAWEHHLYFS